MKNAASKKSSKCNVSFIFANGSFEEINSKKLEQYKQANPNDWWLAKDNAVMHKYEIAIQCIARQEELYFKEWIEHHLAIGIEHIFIYDNNDTSGLEDFLRGTLSSDNFSKIEVIPWHEPMEFQQFEALKDCVKKNKHEVKWLLSIDLDEFFILEQPMNKFLDEIADASQVYFSWESIGADGQLYYEDKPVMQRFKTRFDCDETMQGKSMFRPERLKNWHVHYAELYQGKTLNALLKEIEPPQSDANIYTKAWIKHFFTKSLEEWTKKMYRGCADNHWCRKYSMFFECNPDLKEHFDPSVIQIQQHANAPIGEEPLSMVTLDEQIVKSKEVKRNGRQS